MASGHRLGVPSLHGPFLKDMTPSSALCVPLRGSFRHNAALCTVRERLRQGEGGVCKTETVSEGKGRPFVYKVAGEDRQTGVRHRSRAACADVVNGF